MNKKFIPLFLIFPIFMSGCFSAPRPLFYFSDSEQLESENYNYKIQSDSVQAELEGSFQINYQAELRIKMNNSSKDAFLINFDRGNIWLKTCEEKKSYLSEVYVNEVGFNPEQVILYSNKSRYIVITFDKPSCLPFDVEEEKFVFPIHLNGIELQKRSKEKLELFNKVVIFARQ